ncbi:hypothetical protein IFM89_039401 [Coptis chinensis]|uniref:Uncharacterized protein n=1 Tax=Coptis chinensis TaxID=261450 RepID=A0A835I6D3_9MAGN|nr:hypothetical protein IFM89_039401 [Coptis chinensis]
MDAEMAFLMANQALYGLPMPVSLLRADNNLPPWRPGLKEGIVDPYTVPDDKRLDHVPSTAPYSLAECIHDLFELAARMLVMGGRLVFFTQY